MKRQLLLPFFMATLLVNPYPQMEIARADQPLQIAQSIWKPFSSAEGGFTVLMPGTPISEQQTIDDEQLGSVNLNGFIVERPDEAIYIVIYADLPATVALPPGGADTLLQRLVQEFSNAPGDRILNQQTVNLGNYPGKDVKVQHSGGITGRYRIYLANQRLYVLGVGTSKEQYLQKSIQGFLDSFQLTNSSPPSAGTPNTPGARTPNTPPPPDLNAQLQQAVCNQNWAQAIKVVDQMIASSPSSGETRQQLIEYKNQLQSFANANAEIPPGLLASCTSGSGTR